MKLSSTSSITTLKKPTDIMPLKNCNRHIIPDRILIIFLRYGRGWKYHYPTETWITEQDPANKKYFNTLNWHIKGLQDGEINQEEFLTLNEFKVQNTQ